MNFGAGTKLLQRGAILHYIWKTSGPTSISEIYQLLGVPVRGSADHCNLTAGEHESRTNAARQLMHRLAQWGWVEEGRAPGRWALVYLITPRGKEIALEYEQFVSAIIASRERAAALLKTRAPLAGPANFVTPGANQPSPPSPPSSPAPAMLAKAPRAKTLPKGRSKPATPPPVKMSAPPVPRLPPRSPPANLRRTLTCPRCYAAYPLSSVRRQVDREGRFECDSCGTGLTKQAAEMLEECDT